MLLLNSALFFSLGQIGNDFLQLGNNNNSAANIASGGAGGQVVLQGKLASSGSCLVVVPSGPTLSQPNMPQVTWAL